MTAWFRGVQVGLGSRLAWTAASAVALGVVAFLAGLFGGDAPRTFGSLIASWLFFAGLAAGALAFRAFFQIVGAKWARPLSLLGASQIGFAPVALGILVVILVGAGLATWLPASSGVWLARPFLIGRELLLTGGLFGFAYAKLRPAADGGPEQPAMSAAVTYCLLFAIILSVWSFDFVLGPDRTVQSTMVGPYVFMSAFIGASGVLTLYGIITGRLTDKQRRDVGAFTLALSIFWGYLFWSQYLCTWYGNLPEEVSFALRRSVAEVLAIVALVFALPFLALLTSKGRSSARVLSGVLIAQLTGLWLSCNMIVVPTLAPAGAVPVGPIDVLIGLGMLGAFVLAASSRAIAEVPAR